MLLTVCWMTLQGGVGAQAPAPAFVSTPLRARRAVAEDSIDAAMPLPIETVCGTAAKEWILDVNGGGLLLGDLDGEGRNDVIVVDGSTLESVLAGEPGRVPRALLNLGLEGEIAFREGGAGWAMAAGRFGTGGALGDVDNDGDLDVLLTEWGPDRMLLNDDGKGLVEVTDEAGLDQSGWSTSAAFLDLDADGWLDLAVVRYLDFDPESIAAASSGECRWRGHAVMCGPEGLTPLSDRLFRGLGNGRFEDRSAESGLAEVVAGFGLGIATLDVDDDGDTDFYVSNDSTPNHLFENQGDFKVVERAAALHVDLDRDGHEQAGMGVASGDLNGDGCPEVFVTNFSGEHNALYQSKRRASGKLGFRERAHAWALGAASQPRLGWGTGFLDLELDGDLDLVVFNGHVYPQADLPGTDTTYAQVDDVFWNSGARFERGAFEAGEPARVSRAAAAADFDGDGDRDVLSIELDGPVWLHENVVGVGHWLEVLPRRRGREGTLAAEAIGARVTLEVIRAGTQEVMRREIATSGGFQAAIPAVATFGLGTNEVELRRLVVRFVSGSTVELDADALERAGADRRLIVDEPGLIVDEPAASDAVEESR